MPVHFDWDNEQQTVLWFTATAPWNWTDFHRAMRQATFWLDAVQHPVDLVVDLRQSHKLPAGALGHIRSLGTAIHPNGQNRVVIIGLDEAIAGPLGGVDRVYSDGTRLIRFVDTADEARAIVHAWQTQG
jgi:hypothetical protein